MYGLYYIDGQILSGAFCTHKRTHTHTHCMSNKGIINYICGVLLEKQREMKYMFNQNWHTLNVGMGA